VGGYFFQPRAISHKGFIAATDWSESRRIHEEAENDDDTEETAEGGEQSADTRTTPPALDPDHASAPKEPLLLLRCALVEDDSTLLPQYRSQEG